MIKKQENILIIHDIRSVTNVGAMFRTADASGINKIYLTGFTPTPLDRFGKVRKDMAKSALGAENFVAWEYKKNTSILIDKLKKDGYFIIGIEQDKKSVDYKKAKLQKRNVFIVGAEVTGVPKNILQKCDVIAEIPMKGKKESLNVSVACGVALFRILNV
ncbi:MAG: tRNA/rRNA methyltransferase (SpoU) [Candidatus Nomurabacteria bacterium GW2011_GWE1_32_28]|uniref:tRNA/rRNA methyltransferase (SpoU) n=1 Tax=Candidatus Nomurabacteria bacterium GW2011_GWF1_31_48 TaxID=1618767 RepID=A0A0F9YF76_9BACT|nr:MAG: tRNA/rRNA methyltransferase (SpoU) [Candidatus Nomurabacteria bacterium GW2011_GWF2_30_133]KKP28771.1 MAG: tRNA/rRNA methyltransferase (SpoU) [Candidatus Nomurabacteria bacterium GW2011_GWE2_31_40]KKP30349.1 MAG: tRNA/rRNA methyltransferase (SpoU) [Candidatus Nomurabacteria bacterium GW2011_GWF1_31_48]KKP34876.1 MAG: tRNA/rRNA methyltransferase (SpoU) [Candidatus Nomurabacteria bacterium GW2011_GWE1_32_28]HAS80967.1 RNA methyltransferase [Candidatus Nomurabacteria bacterium]